MNSWRNDNKHAPLQQQLQITCRLLDYRTVAVFWNVFDCIHLIIRKKLLNYPITLDLTGVICTRRLFEEQEEFQPLLSNNTDNNSDYVRPAGTGRKYPWQGFNSQVKSIICCTPELRDSRVAVRSSDFYFSNPGGALLKAFNDCRIEYDAACKR